MVRLGYGWHDILYYCRCLFLILLVYEVNCCKNVLSLMTHCCNTNCKHPLPFFFFCSSCQYLIDSSENFRFDASTVCLAPIPCLERVKRWEGESESETTGIVHQASADLLTKARGTVLCVFILPFCFVFFFSPCISQLFSPEHSSSGTACAVAVTFVRRILLPRAVYSLKFARLVYNLIPRFIAQNFSSNLVQPLYESD